MRGILRNIFRLLALAMFVITCVYCVKLLVGEPLTMEGQTMPYAMSIGAAALAFLLGNLFCWFLLACAKVAERA